MNLNADFNLKTKQIVKLKPLMSSVFNRTFWIPSNATKLQIVQQTTKQRTNYYVNFLSQKFVEFITWSNEFNPMSSANECAQAKE